MPKFECRIFFNDGNEKLGIWPFLLWIANSLVTGIGGIYIAQGRNIHVLGQPSFSVTLFPVASEGEEEVQIFLFCLVVYHLWD